MTDTIEFQAWPKIYRLHRGIIITEKIDGTNACVIVTNDGQVAAQSRTRLITPESDNFGFAAFVRDNADALRDTLGPGYHYGEWYGHGIQRGYGLTSKRFDLFNATKWEDTPLPDGVGTVPVLYKGAFSQEEIDGTLADLRDNGSVAAPGWPAEGIIVYLTAARTCLKVMCENDEVPKGLAA